MAKQMYSFVMPGKTLTVNWLKIRPNIGEAPAEWCLLHLTLTLFEPTRMIKFGENRLQLLAEPGHC